MLPKLKQRKSRNCLRQKTNYNINVVEPGAYDPSKHAISMNSCHSMFTKHNFGTKLEDYSQTPALWTAAY